MIFCLGTSYASKSSLKSEPSFIIVKLRFLCSFKKNNHSLTDFGQRSVSSRSIHIECAHHKCLSVASAKYVGAATWETRRRQVPVFNGRMWYLQTQSFSDLSYEAVLRIYLPFLFGFNPMATSCAASVPQSHAFIKGQNKRVTIEVHNIIKGYGKWSRQTNALPWGKEFVRFNQEHQILMPLCIIS